MLNYCRCSFSFSFTSWIFLTLGSFIGGSSLIAGESVWLEMDQSALDDAYDQSVYAPNLDQVLGRFDSRSEIARARLGAPQLFAYGKGRNETMDVYPTNTDSAPIFIFIHGGAWKLGSASQNAFGAENLVGAGAHFVVPDFSPVQDFDGNLMAMADQLRRCLVWIYQNAEDEFGGDPERIYLSGFSSGGHLAATLLTVDWSEYENVPTDIIKGALICSGMYDLYPVSLSFRSEYVDFNEATLEELSPILHLERINCPLVIAYGTYETPEFKRQAIEFTDALKKRGHPVTLLRGDGYNHFEMAETLGNPYGVLGRAARELLETNPSE